MLHRAKSGSSVQWYAPCPPLLSVSTEEYHLLPGVLVFLVSDHVVVLSELDRFFIQHGTVDFPAVENPCKLQDLPRGHLFFLSLALGGRAGLCARCGRGGWGRFSLDQVGDQRMGVAQLLK